MTFLLDRLKRKHSPAKGNHSEHRYVKFPILFLLLGFITSIGYASGSLYWIFRKDNELEKSRRIELDLRNNIKERDYVIQQYRQQIKQLEKRVEILDAIQELSANTVSPKERTEIAKLVYDTSEKYGHDPFLILALMSTESSMQPDVTSPKGAKGLMQLMPSTGDYLSEKILQSPKIIGAPDDEQFDVPHYRNLQGNIELGTLYLTQLMVRYQNLEHAIYAYNLGPNLFEKRLKEGGPYPRQYLGKVMNKYARLIRNRRSQDEKTGPTFYSSRDLHRLLAQAHIPPQ